MRLTTCSCAIDICCTVSWKPVQRKCQQILRLQRTSTEKCVRELVARTSTEGMRPEPLKNKPQDIVRFFKSRGHKHLQLQSITTHISIYVAGESCRACAEAPRLGRHPARQEDQTSQQQRCRAVVTISKGAPNVQNGNGSELKRPQSRHVWMSQLVEAAKLSRLVQRLPDVVVLF